MPKPLSQADVKLKAKIEALLDRDYPQEGASEKGKAYRQSTLEQLNQLTDDTLVSQRETPRQALAAILKELQEGSEDVDNAVEPAASSEPIQTLPEMLEPRETTVLQQATTAIGLQGITLAKQARLKVSNVNSPVIGQQHIDRIEVAAGQVNLAQVQALTIQTTSVNLPPPDPKKALADIKSTLNAVYGAYATLRLPFSELELPISQSYINLAIVHYQEQAQKERALQSASPTGNRVNLNEGNSDPATASSSQRKEGADKKRA